MSINIDHGFAIQALLKFNIVIMPIRIYQVDAFVDTPFSGNPAVVCVLDKEVKDRWMQDLAMEMNLSETAFLLRSETGYNLRWFTPSVEVDLCGHATLASAHILWEEGYIDSAEKTVFYTKSGELSASKKEELIELNFPSEPHEETPIPEGLSNALGVDPIYVGKNRMDYLVQIESEEVLRNLEPDYEILRMIPSRGIIVTSSCESQEFDFVSRFFAPNSGIDEDPVTGSAHCCLGPFWAKKLGKTELKAYQASKRGGIVYVSLKGNRVYLGGKAATIFKGEIA